MNQTRTSLFAEVASTALSHAEFVTCRPPLQPIDWPKGPCLWLHGGHTRGLLTSPKVLDAPLYHQQPYPWTCPLGAHRLSSLLAGLRSNQLTGQKVLVYGCTKHTHKDLWPHQKSSRHPLIINSPTPGHVRLVKCPGATRTWLQVSINSKQRKRGKRGPKKRSKTYSAAE